MPLTKYEVLDRVVRCGNLTKAADEMKKTQSAVSHVIAGLEEELGFPVLERSKSGVRLTDAGERIMPAVHGILNYEEQIRQIAAEVNGARKGLVRIGTFTSAAVHWLPGIIKEFRRNYPDVEFRLLNGDYHDIEEALRTGAIDIGFVTLPCRVECECVPLARDELVAVLPREHKLAGERAFPLSCVESEDYISLLESSNHDAQRVLDSAGIIPRVRYTTKDDYAIIAMVANGLGISIMPEMLVRDYASKVCVKSLDPPAYRTVALAYADRAKAGPATKRFAAFVSEWIGRNVENAMKIR